MSLALRLLAAVFGGFAAHRFYKPSLSLGQRWGNMLRYAIGALCLLPFLLMVQHELRNDSKPDDALLASYLLTIGAVGTGTFVGHLTDRIEGDDPA
jgi:uncharacterized membrane protein required for colicin V production